MVVVFAAKLGFVFACFLGFLTSTCRLQCFCSSDSDSVLVDCPLEVQVCGGLWDVVWVVGFWVLFWLFVLHSGLLILWL